MNIHTNDVQRWLSGDIFRNERLQKQYRLILLIVGLVFIYILAGYHGARQQRRMSDLKQEVKDKRFEYLTISAQLTETTKQSAIIEELQHRGSRLKENTSPVIQIIKPRFYE